MTAARPTCVVLALTATGIAVARDLQGAWRVIGVDAERQRPGWYSSAFDRPRGIADLPFGLALVDAIVDLAGDASPLVVIPAADDAVAWCIDHRATLCERGVRLAAGYRADAAGVLVDKSRFAARCAELGIDVPRTAHPADRADALAFAREVGLPCIVKPRAGHLWRQRLRGHKLITPASVDELERVLDEIVGDPRAVVLQELVGGPESNLVVGAVWAGADGRVRHVLTARKIRQFPRQFGSGSLVRTEALPDVAERSRDVVEALGYAGLCGTEFKIDPRSGRLRLIEINARPTLWYDLCRAAGTHVVRAHACDLAGLPCAPPAAQRDGVVWRYAVRDAIALAQAGPAAFARAVASDGAADTDAVFDRRDPWAAIGSLVHTAAQAIAHLPRRAR